LNVPTVLGEVSINLVGLSPPWAWGFGQLCPTRLASLAVGLTLVFQFIASHLGCVPVCQQAHCFRFALHKEIWGVDDSLQAVQTVTLLTMLQWSIFNTLLDFKLVVTDDTAVVIIRNVTHSLFPWNS
jgi:hypothetical protein